MRAYHSDTPIEDKDEQETPRSIFEKIQKTTRVQFMWDVCASEANTKIKSRFWSIEDDALALSWLDYFEEHLPAFWMNPPYSSLPTWTRKAMLEAREGCIVVGCVPDMPSSLWYRTNVWNKAATILRPDGRINFLLNGKPRSSNPLPTCFPIWTPWRAQSTYMYFKR